MYTYIHIFFSIHLSMDTGCSQILDIVNNAAENMGVQVYFHGSDIFSSGYIPKSRIAILHGSSISNF